MTKVDAPGLAGAAARGGAVTMVGQWVKFAVQLVAIAVLARLLTPADFGTVAMIMAIAGIALLLSDFGLSLATIQAKSLSNAQRANLFWINMGLGIVVGAAVFLSAPAIAAFYGDSALVPVTQVIAVVFLLNAATAQFKAETSRKLRFRWLAVTDIAAQVVAVAAAIAVGLLGGGYWALVTQQVVAAVIIFVLSTVSAGWWPGLPRRGAPMKSLLVFGVNTVGVQAVNYVSSNADSVLIGRFNGAADLGFYDRAYQLFRVPMRQIAVPMTKVALPVLSRIDDDARYDRYVQRAQILLAYGFGGAFFALAAASDPIIEIMLGPGWDPAKSIFRVLAIGGVFEALVHVYFWVFVSKALTGMQLRYSLVARTLMVAFMAVGVIWGPMGVAVGSAAGLALNWVLLSFLALPKTGVDAGALVRVSLRPMVIMAAMLVVTLPFNYLVRDWSPVPQLAVLGGVMALFLTLVFVVVRPARADLGHIVDTIKRMRSKRG